MLQKSAVCALLLSLAFAFSSVSLAQDAKKEVKKETKPSIINDAKKEVSREAKSPATTEPKKDAKKATKSAAMKFVSCSQSGCGFWAKSHSAKELRYIMKRHFKKYHKVELTDKQLKEMVKKEGTK